MGEFGEPVEKVRPADGVLRGLGLGQIGVDDFDERAT